MTVRPARRVLSRTNGLLVRGGRRVLRYLKWCLLMPRTLQEVRVAQQTSQDRVQSSDATIRGAVEQVAERVMGRLAQGMTDEITQLRDQHAACYDVLVETCREQARAIEHLNARLDSLTHSSPHTATSGGSPPATDPGSTRAATPSDS